MIPTRTRTAIGLAAIISVLSACTTDRTIAADPSIEATDLTALPEPKGEFFYTIGPQEKL